MGFFGPTEWYSQKDVDKRLAKAKANCESRIGMERQRYEASIRQIKDIQKALIERRIISDDARDEMRKGMERIAQMLCAASVDELNTYSPERLSVIPDEELAKWIIKDVKGQLDELRHAVRYNQTTQGLYEEEKARAERLQQQVDHLIKELKQTRENLKHEQTQASLAKQALADAQNRLSVYASIPDVQAPAPDAVESAEQIAAVFRNTLPGWIQDWQDKPYYDRDFEFLRILATTGTPLRREAAEMFARKMDVESRSGSMSRMYARFEKMGLIELIEAKSDTSGFSRVKLIRLTTRGMDTARLIMSRDPAPSQLTELLARHKTPEHVLLKPEAAELLRDAMYTVDLFPSPIPINGDVEESERSYAPDSAPG